MMDDAEPTGRRGHLRPGEYVLSRSLVKHFGNVEAYIRARYGDRPAMDYLNGAQIERFTREDLYPGGISPEPLGEAT